jgi:hypothetical protein
MANMQNFCITLMETASLVQFQLTIVVFKVGGTIKQCALGRTVVPATPMPDRRGLLKILIPSARNDKAKTLWSR